MSNSETVWKLRPHHALCVQFFCGEGYSEAFVQHLAEVIAALNRSGTLVELTEGADCICADCPHFADGVCDAEEKVKRYDGRVLAYCGLSFGDVLSFRHLARYVRSSIILDGRMREVCGDCQWAYLCHK